MAYDGEKLYVHDEKSVFPFGPVPFADWYGLTPLAIIETPQVEEPFVSDVEVPWIERLSPFLFK